MESGLVFFLKMKAVATQEHQLFGTRCCFQDAQELVAENLQELQQLKMANFYLLFRAAGLSSASLLMVFLVEAAFRLTIRLPRLRPPQSTTALPISESIEN